MAEGGLQDTQSRTLTETVTESDRKSPKLVLKLKKKEDGEKKVKWTNDTVDNEFMGKKKSKCCCIYKKPHMWDESSSDDSDDDCEHCSGHKGKDYRHRQEEENNGTDGAPRATGS